MFCIYCGKELPARAAFCVYCGKTLPRTDRAKDAGSDGAVPGSGAPLMREKEASVPPRDQVVQDPSEPSGEERVLWFLSRP